MNKKQKHFKRLILAIFTILVIGFLFLSNNQDIRQQFQGSLSSAAQPQLNIWKLTHLPTTAPEGTLINNKEVISLDTATDYEPIMSIALEAIDGGVAIDQLNFEIDLDDNSQQINPSELAAQQSTKKLILFTPAGKKLAQAEFKANNNQLIAELKPKEFNIKQGQIKTIDVFIQTSSSIQESTPLRIQLESAAANATAANNSSFPTQIHFNLGNNNNQNLADDLLASETIEIAN